jgi:hypothetical protein
MTEKPNSSPMNKCDATIVTKTKSSQKTNCDHSGVFNDANVTSLMKTSLLVSANRFRKFELGWEKHKKKQRIEKLAQSQKGAICIL